MGKIRRTRTKRHIEAVKSDLQSDGNDNSFEPNEVLRRIQQIGSKWLQNYCHNFVLCEQIELWALLIYFSPDYPLCFLLTIYLKLLKK